MNAEMLIRYVNISSNGIATNILALELEDEVNNDGTKEKSFGRCGSHHPHIWQDVRSQAERLRKGQVFEEL